MRRYLSQGPGPLVSGRGRRRIGSATPWSGPGRRILAGILCAPLLASGCLFSTRTPETPSVNEVPWTDPLTPAKVLTNVQVTFQAKSVANYNRSLASDFTFQPSEADRAFVAASGDPTAFDEWTKDTEVAAFNSVFGQTGVGTVTVTWGPPVPPAEDMLDDDADPGGGKYFENLPYKMVFRQSAAADTTFSGLVNLYLREQTGGWIIYKWVDQQDGTANETLGLLRWKKQVWE